MSAEPISRVTHVTVLVEDADEALSWFTEKLGFTVEADEAFGDDDRWLTVAPPDQDDLEIVLMEAEENDADRVGRGTMTVVRTRDCDAAHGTLTDRGVTFLSDPEPMPWGISAVFVDLYGNPYNLLEPA